MPASSSRKAYLVNSQENGDEQTVDTAVTTDPAAAIAAVAARLGTEPARRALAGSLSRHTVNKLGPKPGEVEQIRPFL